MGADFSAELSIYDLVVYSDFDSLFAAGLIDENGCSSDWNKDVKKWDYFEDERHIELHMLDGTVFSDEVFSGKNSTHFVRSMSNCCRDVEKGRCMLVLSFSVPIDVDQIDYIVLNDNRFDFASAE